MPVHPRPRAVTFDFWGTLIDSYEPPAKLERRLELLSDLLRQRGLHRSREALQSALISAEQAADGRGGDNRDIGPRGRWRLVLQHLDLQPDAVPFEQARHALEGVTLDFLPAPVPGAAEVLPVLHRRYRLGVVCNTGWTSGAVLRQVLARHGLLEYFQALTFSDELGLYKPDPRTFWHTLQQLEVLPAEAAHIGDIETLDVDGARAAGMLAIRYSPSGDEHSRADIVVHDLRQLPDVLAHL